MSTALTVNDIIPKQQYVATDGQTLFSYNFPILNATDIQVFRTPAGHEPDDAAQELRVNSDYAVSGVGMQSGGSITMLISIAAGDRITLQRAMPYQRLSSYTNGRRFNPDSLDEDFDSIVMMMQQVHAYYEKRFLRYENTVIDDTDNLRLPTLSNGQIWKRGPDGIAAVTLEENPDSSALRSELANNSVDTDGSRMVGYQDAIIGSTTVHNAIQSYFGFYQVDSGSANAIIINVPNFIGYREGLRILVKISADNTSAVTINISGAGVKNVRLQSDEELPTRTLLTGMIAELVYDGTKFVIMNPFESHSDMETGDAIFSSRTSKVGFVIMNDGTIGSPASNATTLKSNLCKSLFVHLWNTFDNTLAPVIEGRGANAEADWLANKQIQLLHIAGRAIAAAGQGDGLTARLPGQITGEENHMLTKAEIPPHAHSYTTGQPAALDGGGSQNKWQDFIVSNTGDGTADGLAGHPHENMQPTTFLNVFMKL